MTSIATPRVKSAWAWAALAVVIAYFTVPVASWLLGVSGAVAGFLGQALVMLGVFWRLWATVHIGGQKGSSLVTGGPYAMSRHPLYFGAACIMCGLALRAGLPALLALAVVYILVALVPAMRREDAAMAAAFPGEHSRWSRGLSLLLPMRLPGAGPTAPLSLFSLRRETLAAMAVLALYVALDMWTGRAALWLF